MSDNASAAPPVPRVPAVLIAMIGLAVFLANAALLVLQLVAGRLLAPEIGSSIETWTSVIGVFLAGIALGNWLGGKLADRYPSTRTLARLLGLGGLAAMGMVGLVWVFNTTHFYRAIPLGPRIPLLTAMLCLVPSFVFSLITPLAIKLALPDVRRAGRVAGLVFSLSTLGCLVGNYLTGFVLIALYNLNTIVLGISVALLGLAVVLSLLSRFVDSPAAAPAPPADKKALANAPTEIIPPAPPAPKPEPAKSEPAGRFELRGNLPLALGVVFLASFCGMALELTGSRVLAPHLGVSLYTWTGIIGVMLAGTATGNYLGGVLADRGPQVALRGAAIVLGGVIGVVLAPSIGEAIDRRLPLEWFTRLHLGPEGRKAEVRQILNLPKDAPVDDPGGNGLSDLAGFEVGPWLVRLFGLLAGAGSVALCLWLGRRERARPLAVVIGGLAAGPVTYHAARLFCLMLTPKNLNPPQKGPWDLFQDAVRPWSERTGLDVGWLLLCAAGFALGAAAVWSLTRAPKTGGESAGGSADDLSAVLLFAGLTSLAVVGLTEVFSDLAASKAFVGLEAVEQVLVWTFGLFFLPMLLLGTVSPQVIRRTVPDTAHAGRVAGTVYAWSTMGAIAGTFAAGYFLIGVLGTSRVLMTVALLLVLLAAVVGQLWKRSLALYLGSIAVGMAAIALACLGVGSGKYEIETKYYAIAVQEGERQGHPVRVLILDRLQHSFVQLDDPTFLGYQHEYVQGELLRLAAARNKEPKALVIGGGGYTFPRWVEAMMPEASMEVVEIDPGVTEVAHRRLGLSRQTTIRTHNLDGRQFIAEQAPKGHYDLVIQDAVNDFSVPYHLMTKEYNDAVKEALAPGGAYMLTLIDSLTEGELWRAAVHTMRETFPEVHVLCEEDDWHARNRAVYIIYGSNEPLDHRALWAAALKSGTLSRRWGCALAVGGAPFTLRPWTHQMPDDRLHELLRQGDKVILTDQYAPVDNLMSGIFRQAMRGR